MKKWYAMEPELEEKYGPFPAWWKDLLTWSVSDIASYSLLELRCFALR